MRKFNARSLRNLRSRSQDEEAFTLLELMIVIITIGILASIAVPLFAKQQAFSLEATLKSDIKNAATVMQTEATRNQGKYGSYIPSYDTQSATNQVVIDSSKSNRQVYCLVGTNTAVATTFYYSSLSGKISTVPTGCPAVTAATPATTGGASFDVTSDSKLAASKAMIVYNANASFAAPKVNLLDYGYGTVDVFTTAQFVAMSNSAVAQYDIVYLRAYAWAIGGQANAKAKVYYDNGGKVLQDGNDSTGLDSPWISTTVGDTGPSVLTPTYKQGLTPSFPYTFNDYALATNDSWQCITEVKGGAVAIATGIGTSGKTCVNMLAASNGDGRWVHIVAIPDSITSPMRTALTWLNA